MPTTQGIIASAGLSLGLVRAIGPWIATRITFVALYFLASCLPVRAGVDDDSPASALELPGQVALINEHLRRDWESSRIVPSSGAADGEWCRRVFLDTLGRIPRLDELERYLGEPSRTRKARQVERLLGPGYAAEYARNWSTLWTNLLLGRSGGTERNTLINREGLRLALARAIAENLPYDQFVFELLTARGVSKPGEDGFNGFVNFLAGNLQENAVQATARTAQVFLGLQIQCTQCHNHPFNDWKQNQFWEMNAFFRQTRALRRFEEGGRQVTSIELVNQDFAGENNKPDEAAVFYELRNGLTKAAYPAFVDGTKLASESGYISEVDRRGELAKLILASPYLAQANVNRVWAHFFGYGFTRPLDDMGPHNPANHPLLFEALSEAFRQHGYDQKQLVRWLVLSDAYGLSSKPGVRNKKDDPTAGEGPLFSRFYLRQMRPEELYDSLSVAIEASQSERDRDARDPARQKWLEQFSQALATDDNLETTTFNGTIPQTLMMMNGDLIKQATSVEKDGFLHRLAADSKMNNAGRLSRLYLAAFARRPTGQEIATANELMLLRKGDPVAALQDVWWALLNSNEFILNH